jgi:hypothetical protein
VEHFSGSDKNTIPQSVLQRNENKKKEILKIISPLEAGSKTVIPSKDGLVVLFKI